MADKVVASLHASERGEHRAVCECELCQPGKAKCDCSTCIRRRAGRCVCPACVLRAERSTAMANPDKPAKAKRIAKTVPVRSLWTATPTGRQIIVTRVADDWISYIDVGGMGSGRMRYEALRRVYVKAGDGCRIEARPTP